MGALVFLPAEAPRESAAQAQVSVTSQEEKIHCLDYTCPAHACDLYLPDGFSFFECKSAAGQLVIGHWVIMMVRGTSELALSHSFRALCSFLAMSAGVAVAVNGTSTQCRKEHLVV